MQKIKSMNSEVISKELALLNQAKLTKQDIKSALFNLIIYTTDSKKDHSFEENLQKIQSQFPCRIIFLQEYRRSDDFIEVNVSCENSPLCISQISINFSGKEIDQVPYLLLPHLIPDLPIYLLWRQPPEENSIILSTLKPLATRVIFDFFPSDCFHLFAKELLRFKAAGIEMVDMNWIKIFGWRQIFARAFDTQERIDLLEKTSSLLITYHSSDDGCFKKIACSFYLQAWIAVCLKWKAVEIKKEKKNFIIIYEKEQRKILVTISPMQQSKFLDGEIVKLELKSYDEYECIFLRQSTTQLEVKACDPYQCSLPFHMNLPSLQSGKSFIQEVFYEKISEHYFSLLHLISQIEQLKEGH